MGNHAVGSMYNAAMALVDDKSIDRMDRLDALEILDNIHVAIKDDYYFSDDAEFDDMDEPWEKFGKLLCMAFCPERYAEFSSMTEHPEEDGDYDWYDAVVGPFRQRYGYC